MRTNRTYPTYVDRNIPVPDWAKTAWDEIDDMAANAGLDYSVTGRRIILNDTHRPVGRLPEFRSTYFASPPKISEYGMLLADVYGVTNGTGLWGAWIGDENVLTFTPGVPAARPVTLEEWEDRPLGERIKEFYARLIEDLL